MMFVQLKDLQGDNVVCNSDDIECIHVGKIDRKGNTATVIKFKRGGYFCVSESVSEVVERIGSPMFITLNDYDLSTIAFNMEQIVCVYSSTYRKTKGRTGVSCRSGRCYEVYESVSNIYLMLTPRLFINADD